MIIINLGKTLCGLYNSFIRKCNKDNSRYTSRCISKKYYVEDGNFVWSTTLNVTIRQDGEKRHLCIILKPSDDKILKAIRRTVDYVFFDFDSDFNRVFDSVTINTDTINTEKIERDSLRPFHYERKKRKEALKIQKLLQLPPPVKVDEVSIQFQSLFKKILYKQWDTFVEKEKRYLDLEIDVPCSYKIALQTHINNIAITIMKVKRQVGNRGKSEFFKKLLISIKENNPKLTSLIMRFHADHHLFFKNFQDCILDDKILYFSKETVDQENAN